MAGLVSDCIASEWICEEDNYKYIPGTIFYIILTVIICKLAGCGIDSFPSRLLIGIPLITVYAVTGILTVRLLRIHVSFSSMLIIDLLLFLAAV